MIDIEKLKVLATAATPGAWSWAFDSEVHRGMQHGVRSAPGLYVADCYDNAGPLRIGQGRPNAEFIAAASPDTVLALIARIAELEATPVGVAVPGADWCPECHARESTPTADPGEMPDFAGVDGANAFHLIERHSSDWTDAGRMMDAFVASRAAPAVQRPALSDAVEAMKRAKLLPIWDNDVPNDLHVELDIIFKALAAHPAPVAQPAQPVADFDLDGRHIPANFTTHRESWRCAIEDKIGSTRGDDQSYWRHELAAYDRAFTRLLSGELKHYAAPSPQDSRDALDATYVTLTVKQLLDAIEFLAPEYLSDPDQVETEILFGVVQHQDDEGNVGTAMCCWNEDSEGVLPLEDDRTAIASTATKEPKA